VEPEATSLALEGAEVDRAALLATVLERLERRYDAWVSAAR
jgi:biotin-(acetyl-CoA carboxylase) ligase